MGRIGGLVLAGGVVKRVAVAAAWLGLCACRMGGAGGRALALVEPDGGTLTAEDHEGGTNIASTGGGTSSPSGSTTTGSVGANSGSATVSDAGQDFTSSTCTAPMEFAFCDPLQNLGCPPLTQCAIDPAGDGLSGTCLFGGAVPADPSVACEQNGLSTSCAPQEGCVQGACRRYCRCDSDCDAGSTCSVEVSTSGPVRACSS